MTESPTMTAVIASYQRCHALTRLLDALEADLVRDPAQRDGFDVVVVLDGSGDRSADVLARRDFPVPLHVIARAEQRGLATTRNDGLEAAGGDLVWFLDDDLVPSPGLIARHRVGHADGVQRVVVGPCPVPSDAPTLQRVKFFWGERYADLHASGRIERFDHFSAANTSGPAELFRRVGGFNEAFVGYGLEDYELACRLLTLGVPLIYDDQAVAEHPQQRTIAEMCKAKSEEGRNAMRLIGLHPHATDALVPLVASRTARLVGLLTRGSPRALARLTGVTIRLASAEARLAPQAHGRLLTLAMTVSFAHGVAESDADGVLVSRLLGLAS